MDYIRINYLSILACSYLSIYLSIYLVVCTYVCIYIRFAAFKTCLEASCFSLFFQSKFTYVNHMKSREGCKQDILSSLRLVDTTGFICDKVSKSLSSLKRHLDENKSITRYRIEWHLQSSLRLFVISASRFAMMIRDWKDIFEDTVKENASIRTMLAIV